MYGNDGCACPTDLMDSFSSTVFLARKKQYLSFISSPGALWYDLPQEFTKQKPEAGYITRHVTGTYLEEPRTVKGPQLKEAKWLIVNE